MSLGVRTANRRAEAVHSVIDAAVGVVEPAAALRTSEGIPNKYRAEGKRALCLRWSCE